MVQGCLKIFKLGQSISTKYFSVSELYKETGVELLKLNVDTYKTDGILDSLKKKRGYNYEDEVTCSKDRLPNYDEVMKAFATEHLHADEEIRFILEGSGYFDVRDRADQWIRIAAGPGDLVVMPSGIYHRFSLDSNDYIKAKRFFIGSPVWKAYNRPADEMLCRKRYLDNLQKGFFASNVPVY